MQKEEYKPIPRDDQGKVRKRVPVGETRRIPSRPLRWKALRPDAPENTSKADKDGGMQKKQHSSTTPLPRASRKPSSPMDALIRKSEADEQRKRRAAEKRRREAAAKGTPRANGVGAKSSVTRSGHTGNIGNTLMANPVVSRRLISVASVAFLLLVLWLSASFFIDAMSDRPRGSESESSAVSKEESEPPEESSTAQSSASDQESSSDDALPKPLTEGDADYQKPDTWIGKTFLVEDDANVRSDGGTQNTILFTVNPGEKFMVKQAKMVDDAAWVKGIAIKKDGTKKEGWIYSYCLGYKPQ